MKNIDSRSVVIGFIVAALVISVLYVLVLKPSGENVVSDRLPIEDVSVESEPQHLAATETKYICQGYKSTYLHEKVDFLRSKEVEDVLVEAGTPTDKATIVVDEGSSYIGLLTAASVGIGDTEPHKYENFSTPDDRHIVGWEQVGTRVETLLFNKNAKSAVWSKIGNFGPVLGTSAQAIYFVCAEAP